ncbi:aminotransferase class V-fold PLP-dependent enzyme [Nonomuraea indica]|uniref:aminotransferase class V-fold PLP-dependent enzyme n=1 Tax=Nonomuraea indica TaxID=1581193 RepID=UPI001FE758E1|nr:aminotransferase class V-fold PLP-dependent enzyme [Nonomuraea indica]
MNVQSAYLSQFQEPPGYLDFARIGPPSLAVTRTVAQAAESLARDPSAALTRLELEASGARAAAARLLSCAPHEVAFVSSTSHALFAAAAGLDGGVVLVPRGEFPANVYPWLRFQERGGLRPRWIDSVAITPDVLREHLDGDVRALALSAVDATTGHRAPLGELKEVLGEDRLLVVDGVQGLGAVPLEVTAADVLACGGQKWLRAGWGAALMLIRDRVADRLMPGLGGWAGVQDPFGARHPTPPLAGAVAHTATNPDLTAVAALGAAIDLVLSAGEGNIARQIARTLASLLDAARTAGAEVLAPTEPAGIARVRLPGRDPASTHAALGAAGLTTTLRGGWIRLSPHATTPVDTADRLRAALTPRRETHT